MFLIAVHSRKVLNATETLELAKIWYARLQQKLLPHGAKLIHMSLELMVNIRLNGKITKNEDKLIIYLNRKI